MAKSRTRTQRRHVKQRKAHKKACQIRRLSWLQHRKQAENETRRLQELKERQTTAASQATHHTARQPEVKPVRRKRVAKVAEPA